MSKNNLSESCVIPHVTVVGRFAHKEWCQACEEGHANRSDFLGVMIAAIFDLEQPYLDCPNIQLCTSLSGIKISSSLVRVYDAFEVNPDDAFAIYNNGAGFKVNAYIFPCLAKKCAPPQEQVETTINRLKSESVEYDMVFLDIQIFDWPNDKEANRKFINAMGNKLDEMCVNWGIYTNENNWSNIVGKNFDKWKHKKLWWAYWGANDGTRKKNFKSFGGWKRFYMQQYAGDFKGPCGVNLDLDYMK